MEGVLRFRAVIFVLFACGIARANIFDPLLINGTEVSPTDSTWTMVIRIDSDKPGHCTGTVVGPRAIITAASCVKKGGTATFSVGGTTYTATMSVSPLWPAQEHDMALGITTQDIAGVTPATISGTVSQGMGITLLGYGCNTVPPASGQPVIDNKLRFGDTTVTGVQTLYMTSGQSGALVCYQDNGGPAFAKNAFGQENLVGVNFFGDFKTKNYSIRMDAQASKDFINSFIQQTQSEICGYNGTAQHCQGGPGPGAATCNLVASPPSVQVGGVVTLTLTTKNATSATIDGQTANPVGDTKNITTASVGNFTSHATVNGPGGAGSCDAPYAVTQGPGPGNAPTCTVTATPSQVNIGDSVTLALTVTNGTADYASINGTPVTPPSGQILAKPTTKGDFSVVGFVKNASGSNNCYSYYHVDDGNNPTIPNFAVIPVYCGDNTVNSKVQQVCLSIVKKDSSTTSMPMNQVLQVSYKKTGSPTDLPDEELPILARAPLSKPSTMPSNQVLEQISLFANNVLPPNSSVPYQVLDTRTAKLTSGTRQSWMGRRARDFTVPVSIEGRSGAGEAFNVPQLIAVGTAAGASHLMRR